MSGGKFGISVTNSPLSPYSWTPEEDLLAMAHGPAPSGLSDNKQSEEVLLVDHRGRPLLKRVPRPLGFRKP